VELSLSAGEAWHDRNLSRSYLTKTLYESPVYPGTLTYHWTVSNIEILRAVSGRDLHGVETTPCYGSYRAFVTIFLRWLRRFCMGGEPQKTAMLMRSLETNAGYRRHRASGFSLLEMVAVVAISFVLTVVSVLSLVPSIKQYRITNAYNTTLAALRQARDNAVSQRTSYSVTFSNATTPNTITVAPTLSFQGSQNSVVYKLPTDVSFLAQASLPTTGPDGFGTGTTPIDFGWTGSGTGAGGSSVVYFCPDGSSQAASSCAANWSGGVVYIARSGDLLSSRAITLWGGTGRVHGWRLYPNGGGYQWLRQ
jgi:Tfp pilus assembly protein FimT